MDVRSESDKKKVALGDIKNAPIAQSTNGGKTEIKKVETEKMTEINDDYEYASSRPVDWYEAWIEKRVLPEELINKMARLLTGRYIDPDEVIEPPKPVDEPEDDFIPSCKSHFIEFISCFWQTIFNFFHRFSNKMTNCICFSFFLPMKRRIQLQRFHQCCRT